MIAIVKKLSLIALLCFTIAIDAHIVYRAATMQDIHDLLVLDRAVSYEHFEPLFEQYSDTRLGQNAHQNIEDTFIPDEEMFTEHIESQPNKGLYVACDGSYIVGLIVFEEDDTTIKINLVMVLKDYRCQGIGKQLLAHAINAYTSAVDCMLIAYHKDERVCSYYEKLGFVKLDQPPAGFDVSDDSINYYNYYQLTLKDHDWYINLSNA